MTDIGGWDLPFEEQPTADLALDGVPVAGGIVVMGAMAPTPLGTFPVLVFRFDVPGLASMPTVALILDAERMRGIPALVEQACAAAIRKAAGR